uniref:Transmembrane protein 138 n=1 Tax=Taenia asiatica TaxID=60517 RepID=A0A0R3W005_TAEAS
LGARSVEFFVLLQVFLILEASRREAGETEHTISEPGRTTITFLLVLNLAMWIVNTFALKHAENHEIFRLYYTDLGWKIITHLSLPLITFFRFHSTVYLADIWTNAYRLHYRHTEVLTPLLMETAPPPTTTYPTSHS